MPRTQDIPDANASKAKKAVLEPKVQLERDIRRFVKPLGGFRKGLPESDKKEANGLLEKAKRTVEDGWDMGIVVPGFEAITASPPKAPPEALRDKAVMDLMDTVRRQTAEIDALKNPDPLAGMTIKKLKDYADDANIDIGNLTKKSDIVEFIKDAEQS